MNNHVKSYDKLGLEYSIKRKPDPRIAQYILEAVNQSRSIVNVGAGTGSYEPSHMPITAVEPSMQMIGQRQHQHNVIQGIAESLPFQDASFDTCLAVLTIHHWSDVARGLNECARVARQKVVILTWDPDSTGFWLTQDYFPEILSLDKSIFPSLEQLQLCLGSIQVKAVPVPADCVDGFLGAFWRRPEAYLEDSVRSGMSTFSKIPDLKVKLAQLQKDLRSGVWYETNKHLLSKTSFDMGYRLITASLG